MTRKFIRIVIFSLLLVVATGCAPQSTATTPASSSTAAPSATAAGNLVVIKDFAFDPATLTIHAGDTVTWRNDDSSAHTISSASFSSDTIAKNGTWSHTFGTVGTYDYTCGIHPTMKGKIVVE